MDSYINALGISKVKQFTDKITIVTRQPSSAPESYVKTLLFINIIERILKQIKSVTYIPQSRNLEELKALYSSSSSGYTIGIHEYKVNQEYDVGGDMYVTSLNIRYTLERKI